MIFQPFRCIVSTRSRIDRFQREGVVCGLGVRGLKRYEGMDSGGFSQCNVKIHTLAGWRYRKPFFSHLAPSLSYIEPNWSKSVCLSVCMCVNPGGSYRNLYASYVNCCIETCNSASHPGTPRIFPHWKFTPSPSRKISPEQSPQTSPKTLPDIPPVNNPSWLPAVRHCPRAACYL